MLPQTSLSLLRHIPVSWQREQHSQLRQIAPLVKLSTIGEKPAYVKEKYFRLHSDHFLPNRNLAMVASCMLEVPS